MKCSARSVLHSCRDVSGQCLNSGDYVMDMSFTVTRGRVKPPGRCYRLFFNPIKLPKPHSFYRRIAPREELLLNSLQGTPVWLVARLAHHIIDRIGIEQPACAAQESEKWQHTLNDAIIQLVTHRVARSISAGSLAGVRSEATLAALAVQSAAASASQKRCCLPAGTRRPRRRAPSGSCARGAPRPPGAAACNGREGEEEH
jgi:hypothetical protein